MKTILILMHSHRHRDAPDHHLVYDLREDPHQQRPLRDDVLEAEPAGRLKSLLESVDAPPCPFERTGL